MFVRLLYISVAPEHAADLKQLYHDEIIPSVKYLKGYMDFRLLEPVNKGDDFVALSIWKRQSDALVYESSELNEAQRNQLVSYATRVPVLKTYSAEPAAQESLVY